MRTLHPGACRRTSLPHRGSSLQFPQPDPHPCREDPRNSRWASPAAPCSGCCAPPPARTARRGRRQPDDQPYPAPGAQDRTQPGIGPARPHRSPRPGHRRPDRPRRRPRPTRQVVNDAAGSHPDPGRSGRRTPAASSSKTFPTTNSSPASGPYTRATPFSRRQSHAVSSAPTCDIPREATPHPAPKPSHHANCRYGSSSPRDTPTPKSRPNCSSARQP